MANNTLEPGAGGLTAPKEVSANPLQLQSKPRPQSGMMKHFGTKADVAQAQYETVKEGVQKLSAMRSEMDKLVALQDTVTLQDLVKAGGVLVGAGIPAVQIATILADAPDGPGLQPWLKQKDAAVAQWEAQAEQNLRLTRHEMGVAAMQNIIAHSTEQSQFAAAQPPSGSIH